MNMRLLLPALLIVFISHTALAKESNPNCSQSSCSNAPEITQLIKLEFERAIDGDTFIASGYKIRLWGIDTPEKNQNGHIVAKLFLESIIDDNILECRFISIDRYQRKVMQCLSSGVDIAAMLVKFGMAKDYKIYSSGYYQPEEIEAKNKKRGIWKTEKKGISKREKNY